MRRRAQSAQINIVSSARFVNSGAFVLTQKGDSHTETKTLCAQEGQSSHTSKKTSLLNSLAESTDEEPAHT